MSTATRNFIITFALSVALFVVVASGALNIFENIINSETEVSQTDMDYSYYDDPYKYYEGESDSSEETPTEIAQKKSYIIFYEDDKEELVGAKFICISEEKNRLVHEEIPVNSSIMVNNRAKTIKETYTSNGKEYLCSKLEYVLGVPVEGYMVFDPKSIEKLIVDSKICVDHKITVNCTLPYEVRYEDPGMKEFNELNPDEKVYITLSGNIVVTEANVTYLFDNVPDDTENEKAVSQMFVQIYDSVYKSVFSSKTIKASSGDINSFFGLFDVCTINVQDYLVPFHVYDGTYTVMSFPSLNESDEKTLSWENLPEELKNFFE